MPAEFSFKDYYLILEISDTASPADIKSAFRRLARQTHPDMTGDPKSYERFILIREAYDILTSPDKRPEYDRLRKAYYELKTPEARKSSEYMKEVFEEFDVAENSFYRDEWEFFVSDPEEYLGLFDSALKMIAASFLSAIGGVAATLGVFFVILLSVTSLTAALLLFGLSFAESPFSSVIVVFLSIRIFRRMKNLIRNLFRKFIIAAAALMVRPLKGIPRQIGSSILNLNYTFAFAVFSIPGYRVVTWAYKEASAALSGPSSIDYGRYLAAILFSVGLVVLFSPSLVVIFEVIKEALLKYPQIMYTRYRIKKQREIGAQERKSLGYFR